MRTRAQTTGCLHLGDEINSAARSDRRGAAARPQIRDCLLTAPTERQRALITQKFKDTYKMPPRDLQVESVLQLVKRSNTFLLAGTGYGKTRVPELYYLLHVKQTNPIVLVLNPLDALGDNQVSQIICNNFTLGLTVLIQM